ncbi:MULTISPECIES: hypothetical protein [Cyanophyceae]|uniref:hypothetical protein n=1 Tax=Cyanophyceae TaxID=3028117 RepID=UPI0016868DB1|nr:MULTISPECIES: hypothetical protein [Cyanophyceae]MBD1917437.1 hypothetical protein [Phormidium sp. FACHB-77]MBD2032318.1 hypothetical protein [Phormidium sp. FACHB-322]MBD2052256.1 hypothetical protein [Leptolyngbya sp. FACHB-60]
MTSQSQQKILNRIETTGHYTTTSDRSAKVAHSLSDQEVQHVYSSVLPGDSGKTTHRFMKRQRCQPQ